eukprot:6197462-Pleurochrysis_carterae.AAC.1
MLAGEVFNHLETTSRRPPSLMFVAISALELSDKKAAHPMLPHRGSAAWSIDDSADFKQIQALA